MKKNKLFYINPASSHNVFKGRRYFHNKYFEFFVVSDIETSDFGTFKYLTYKRLFRLGKNFIVFYNKNNLIIKKEDLVLIGDIFTNTLCYTLKRGKRIYYSEFFEYRKSFWKKAFFWTIGLLFFYNKRVLVPTILAKETYSKITKKVFYLPQIYYGETSKSVKRDDKTIKLLFVGRISNAYKNIDFMIRNYLLVKKENPNISLTLVGKVFDNDFFEKYQQYIDNGSLIFLGEVDYSKVSKIYTEHDIFVLASDSDPIGAVVQEAMAHSCAMLISDTTGASCYMKDGKNGYIFETNNDIDFRKKLEKIINNPNEIKNFKENSLNIIRNEYRYKNTKRLEQYYQELERFMKS